MYKFVATCINPPNHEEESQLVFEVFRDGRSGLRDNLKKFRDGFHSESCLIWNHKTVSQEVMGSCSQEYQKKFNRKGVEIFFYAK